MIHATVRVPVAKNEIVNSYEPGTPERAELKDALKRMSSERIEIPAVIGGKQLRTGKTSEARMPHKHGHVLATVHEADGPQVEQAIAAAMAARKEWGAAPFHERASIFLKAAELLATRYRPLINAATMLGQSKTAHQAEIDAASESVDFLRFNVQFASQLLAEQPASGPQMWDVLDYRPLDGFVLAVAPFNFTSIALNLPTSPALMGNTVLFKPASTAIFSAWHIMELLREAGLPDGVINFVPGKGSAIGNVVLSNPDLGGI